MHKIQTMSLAAAMAAVGFAAAHVVPVPALTHFVAPLAHLVAPVEPRSPAVDDLTVLLARCEDRARELRLSAYRKEQEQQALGIERCIGADFGDADSAAQRPRLDQAAQRLAEERGAIDRGLAEVQQMVDDLRVLRAADPAAPRPAWLDEVRVRLKMAALESAR